MHGETLVFSLHHMFLSLELPSLFADFFIFFFFKCFYNKSVRSVMLIIICTETVDGYNSCTLTTHILSETACNDSGGLQVYYYYYQMVIQLKKATLCLCHGFYTSEQYAECISGTDLLRQL